MEYSIVGTGNVAWFLAERLKAAGWHCNGIYGRNAVSAAELAGYCQAPAYPDLAAIPDHPGHVCVLAVSDTAISELASGFRFTDTVLIHTSGTSSVELLKTAVAHCGVLWPVYSVTRHTMPARIPFVWEATGGPAKEMLQALLGVLADASSEAGGEQRIKLHLAAVLVNNYVNHLVAVGQQWCGGEGLSFDLLQPLLQQTVQQILSQPAITLQTGPARRGDTVTIDKHLQLLSAAPAWQAVYKALADSIQEMYPGS